VAVFSSAANHAAANAPHTSATAFKNYVFTHGTDASFKAGALFALAGMIAAFALIRVNPGSESPAGGPPS
jgi:putative copper export protein